MNLPEAQSVRGKTAGTNVEDYVSWSIVFTEYCCYGKRI